MINGTKFQGVITDWGGVLTPPLLTTVRAWIDASPELQALYAREHGVVERLAQVAATERAPGLGRLGG